MAITVEIAGIVRTTMVGKSISWTDSVNGQKQARFTLADAADGFVPADGQAVEIKQDGTIRFEGLITGRPRKLAGPAHSSQLTFYQITVASYELLLNKKTVTREYTATAFETIVADLVSTYLSSDGITENVTAGTSHSITFNGETVAEALDILCEIEADGRTWRLDIGKILTIEVITATAAPVVLDVATGTLGLEPRPTITPDRSTYANTVIITGGAPDFQITYKASDATEITARIAVEGGDGIYEYTEERPELKTEGEVQAAAEGVLAKRKTLRERFVGTTRVAGFAAGQSVTVDVASMDISSQVFFIESVRTVTNAAGTEFRHTINGITGDPGGDWQSYYRREKKKPRTIPMQIEATPGLVRVESRRGALVHAPPTIPAEWFQGTASGAIDRTVTVLGFTHDGASMLLIGRGGLANTGGCSGGEFPGCSPACFANRQTVFSRYAITAHQPTGTATLCTSWDELLAHDNFKDVMCVSPDSRHAAVVQYGSPGKLIIIDFTTGEMIGSVNTNMSAQGNGGEPIWIGTGQGATIYWPNVADNDIYVFDVSLLNLPVEQAVFATSVTTIRAIVASSDGNKLYAVGGGGFAGIDASTPLVLVEDSTITAGISVTYLSLALNEAEDIIVAAVRINATEIHLLTLDVSGTTITKNTETTLSLSTNVMSGAGMMFRDNSAFCFSARGVSGANTLEAHVFDVTDPTAPTFTETFSYTHPANFNKGPVKTDRTHQAIYGFAATDAQVTFSVDQYDEIVPYTIDEQLRVEFGGTGHGDDYVPGDILVAVGRASLVRVPVGQDTYKIVADVSLDERLRWEANEIWSIVAKAADHTLVDGDDMVKLNATAAERTVTLPTLAGNLGRIVWVHNSGDGSNAVIVDGNGAELINGASNYSVTGADEVAGFQAGASEWTVIATASSNTTTEFADNAFQIFDESDVTKVMVFEVSGITTGTTRTLVCPDADGTVAILDGVPGGQILNLGLDSGDDGEIHSTTHATKGTINLGDTLIIDEANGGTSIILRSAGDANSIYLGGGGGFVTTALRNTAVGKLALEDVTEGASNVAFGERALALNTEGSFNTAVGLLAMVNNTTGLANTAIGYQALNFNVGGKINVALGYQAMFRNTDGDFNVGAGRDALYANTTGDSNTAIGYRAGRFIADGSTPNETGATSVFLGNQTKAAADAESNQIVIGYNAIGAGSNSVVLGNASILTTLLRGNVGVGATSFGTSAVKVLAHALGTAPSTSPADMYQQWAADWNGAGTAAPHFRTEEDDIIILANQGALTAEDATAIDATYGAVEEAVLNNVRTRIGELEAAAQAMGWLD